MKIHQLLSGINTPVTNEEQQFIENHQQTIKLASLNEKDSWIAQSLVRKGVYTISKDSNTLIPNLNDHST
jgi:uncharacterized protein YifE (UPF0438 family)